MSQVNARRRMNGGTAHVAGTDWAKSGWGSSATLAVTGNDAQGVVTVTTNASDTASASPVITLTFKDGTWGANTPVAVAVMDSDSTGPNKNISVKTTATTLELKYQGTPTATQALVYKIHYIIRGL